MEELPDCGTSASNVSSGTVQHREVSTQSQPQPTSTRMLPGRLANLFNKSISSVKEKFQSVAYLKSKYYVLNLCEHAKRVKPGHLHFTSKYVRIEKVIGQKKYCRFYKVKKILNVSRYYILSNEKCVRGSLISL